MILCWKLRSETKSAHHYKVSYQKSWARSTRPGSTAVPVFQHSEKDVKLHWKRIHQNSMRIWKIGCGSFRQSKDNHSTVSIRFQTNQERVENGKLSRHHCLQCTDQHTRQNPHARLILAWMTVLEMMACLGPAIQTRILLQGIIAELAHEQQIHT